MSISSKQHILHLRENPIRFEPLSSTVDVFYDENNSQLFIVRNQGASGVDVVSPKKENCLPRFWIADNEAIASIKFSNDIKILAIQRTADAVQFCNYISDRYVLEDREYSQACGSATRNGQRIIGFFWTGNRELALVSSQKFEIFEVNPTRHVSRCLKSFTHQTNWFVYSSPYVVLSQDKFILNIFFVKAGFSTYKHAKFDLSSIPIPRPLQERDIALSTIYDKPCLLIIRQVDLPISTQVSVYLIPNQKLGNIEKWKDLQVQEVGRFALNIVDNIVVVHHQQSKRSFVFDLYSSKHSEESNHMVLPVCSPVSIKPFLPVFDRGDAAVSKDESFRRRSSTTGEKSEQQLIPMNIELYSSAWAVFCPNIIIDAKRGYFWTLAIDYEASLNVITSSHQIISFLSFRTQENAKFILLAYFGQVIRNKRNFNIVYSLLQILFKRVNKNDPAASTSTNWYSTILFGMCFTVRELIQPICDFMETVNPDEVNMCNAVINEYYRAACDFSIRLPEEFDAKVVKFYVKLGRFSDLQYFLQYRVGSDSKSVACIILESAKAYPTLFQSAMDILMRIGGYQELIEIYLSQEKVMTAIRLSDRQNIEITSPRKYLEAVLKTKNRHSIYGVFTHLKRVFKKRGNENFENCDSCEAAVMEIEKQFPVTTWYTQ